jgi:hypothetical protein
MEPQDRHSLSDEKSDQDIKRLFDWVESHGGKHRVSVRQNAYGVRGLYSSQDFNLDPVEQEKRRKEVEAGVVRSMEQDEEDVLIKVPNKILVTPYHIGVREAGVKGITYKEVFS